MATEEATVTCEGPGCRNPITGASAMKIMTGHGEVIDFCNRTCLKTYMQGRAV